MSERYELRYKEPVPIRIACTSEVPAHLASAGLEGVKDVISAAGQIREVYFEQPNSADQFKPFSANWYIEQALQDTGGYVIGTNGEEEVDISSIFGFLEEDPRQSDPFIQLLLVDKQLTYNGQFGFGMTHPLTLASVISTFGFEQYISDQKLRQSTFRRIVRHELSHGFGLVKPRSTNIENFLGSHCLTDYCTLSQGMNIQEFVEGAKKEQKQKAYYCPEDLRDLQQHPARDLAVKPISYRGSFLDNKASTSIWRKLFG